MNIYILDRLSYRIFGKYVTAKRGEYAELSKKLLQARINVPFDIYVSRAYFLSILFSLPLGLLLYFLLGEVFTSFFGSVLFLMIPLFAFFSGFSIYKLLLLYPSFEAKLRGRKIDIVLPHAIALMHALSRGSNDIISFFEVISKNKAIYGEVSKEIRSIPIDTEILNIDLRTALKNSAANSPSESFKNFLESLSTIITCGGNLVAFFLTKSEQYRLKALDENKAFMDTLGLFSEIYVTGFAAGPLFIIVLLVVLGLVGGTKYVLLLGIIYLFIPGGSILFILFLSSITEGTGSNCPAGNEDGYREKTRNPVIQKAELRMKIYDLLKNPIKNLIELPERVLYITIPAGLIFFAAATYNNYGLEFNELVYKVDDFLIFTVFIILFPYMLLVEAHFRRIKKISDNFPDLLNRLANLHESGLTLISSIKRLGTSNLGILNNEVARMNTDIELSGSIVDAFRNFGERVNTVSVKRVVLLIENASRITGNIKENLVIAATDANSLKSLEEERKRFTQMHIIILYITFFVFLYVIYSLVTQFLPEVPGVSSNAVQEIVGEGIAFSGIDKQLYVRLFFHASILEGFFSGLVAGQIGENDARLGLKHSVVMIMSAYLLFMFIPNNFTG
ncbi:MAG: type II secretion system F family protein [Candidatus Methanoperedens sp.]|nr:type II secretion system F family protein [Candidatus Methanoperedens sp.]